VLIEIIGMMCPKCQMTVRMLEGTVKRLKIDAEVKFIKDMKVMNERGVKRTPAVFINGEKVSEGGVPNRMLAEGWIRKAQRSGDAS
jgi:hypothetical protein